MLVFIRVFYVLLLSFSGPNTDPEAVEQIRHLIRTESAGMKS